MVISVVVVVSITPAMAARTTKAKTIVRDMELPGRLFIHRDYGEERDKVTRTAQNF